MGPVAVFDKSFLQSLQINEAVWFDHYFSTVITPLFFVETLADLAKEHLPPSRTVEDEVRIISEKTPEVSCVSNVHHVALCEAELRGHTIPLQGRPVISDGRTVVSEGRKGVVFDISPEAEALERWRMKEFMEVEHRFARGWRVSLAGPMKYPGAEYLKWHRRELAGCNTLAEIRELAKAVVSATDSSPHERMRFVFEVLGLQRDLTLLARLYERQGSPSLPVYAPYTSYVLEVEVFFQFSMHRGLISSDRPSNRIDMTYLNYLPFCNIFVSTDRLHHKAVPFFLRNDQVFVSGAELKADLGKINLRNRAFASAVREKGIMEFAPKPPTEGDYLTSHLWDRIIGKQWREGQKLVLPPDVEKKVVEDMLALKRARGTPARLSLDEADALVIERRVQRVKGNWNQISKDLSG